jgi:hypothetical protein
MVSTSAADHERLFPELKVHGSLHKWSVAMKRCRTASG